MSRIARRRWINVVGLGLTVVATAIGLACLGAILWTLGTRGIPALGPALFTQSTPPPGGDGGLMNAIWGSVLMTGLGLAIGVPVGVLAGTYLAEYGRGTRLAATIRFVNDVLLSAPSIIVGLFVYELIVVRMGHFSGLAGAVALAVIAIPVTVRTTEDMINLVPQSIKDASTALGVHHWRTITLVIYPAARSGILTGLLLATARIGGETAPLLFTALNNQFWSSDLNAPLANLPVVIFQFALSPYPDWQRLAWGGALLITLSILLLNVIARVVLARMSGNGR
jgi:phosphate transport system permease protein